MRKTEVTTDQTFLVQRRMNSHAHGLVLTTTASLLWGTVYVSIGVGLQYLDPYSLLFMRFLVASIAILIIAIPFGRRLKLYKEITRPMNWMLGFVYFLGFIFQYVGQDLTNASDATLISNLGPIIAPVFAFFILKERYGKSRGIALCLGLAGLFLIAGPKFSSNSASLLGDMLLFLTAISYAFFIILGKKFNSGSLGNSFAMIITMTLFSLPFAFGSGLSLDRLDFGLLGWIAVFWMALPCGLIAISLYLKGLEEVTVGESSILLLLQVITGLLLAVMLFGENPTPFEMAGALAIGLAVLFSAFDRGRSMLPIGESRNTS